MRFGPGTSLILEFTPHNGNAKVYVNAGLITSMTAAPSRGTMIHFEQDHVIGVAEDLTAATQAWHHALARPSA
jgi:hypothetical protein